MKVGLLPLYLELYDRRLPELRAEVETLVARVADGLRACGLEVQPGAVCRLSPEVAEAVRGFEAAGCRAVVTLHLAYSPSLEAADALCATNLPLIVCDTTLSPAFGYDAPVRRILTDHGIHGVMDLCSVLRRRGKPFAVVAGASGGDSGPPFFSRVARACRSAVAGAALRGLRVLRIGKTFAGMGDFDVGDDLLRTRLGWDVAEISAADLAAIPVSQANVQAELHADALRWPITADPDCHARTARMGLRVRTALRSARAAAFSFNFQSFDGVAMDGGCAVPFLEAGKAMERGIGYAGEGDVLTAGLVGALLQAFGGDSVTFCEIFCPDWAGDSLFLSHMGEINPAVLVPGTAELIRKPYPWGDAADPAIVVGALRPGPATLVDLTLGPDGFELIASDVTVLADATDPDMRRQVRGWIRPAIGAARFLEHYSLAGGTHHHALVWGVSAAEIRAMSRFAGVGFVEIKSAPADTKENP